MDPLIFQNLWQVFVITPSCPSFDNFIGITIGDLAA